MLQNAKWITAGDNIFDVCPDFRKSFNLDFDKQNVKTAKIYASAMGFYKILINGKPVTDTIFNPGWTAYFKRVQHQCFDVTDLLSDQNQLSITAANGWAVDFREKSFYSQYICVIACLEIVYNDGKTQLIKTDESWDVYTSKIRYAHIFHGESVDLTHEPEFVCKAQIDSNDKPLIVDQSGEFVKEQVRVSAKKLIITPKGEKVIDFGQNLAGYVEIRVKGKRGDRISMTFAEVLDRDGNFYNANYRSAKNIVTYTLSGGDDVLKPTFTFQGYRYVRLDEYPFDEIDLGAFTSISVFSDMERTGDFTCGNEKINQLYNNIVWGMRSNYIDVPTDCPQRDERLGWTGDTQVFCRTAALNYNVKKFFKKWLEDVALDQYADGGVPSIVPSVSKTGHRRSAAWGDCATICPMEIYLAYGDKEMLRSHFPMMKKWVDFIHRYGKYEYLWVGGSHYGDWLALDNPDPKGYLGATQRDLIASAFFAYSTSLLIRAGKIIGEEVSEYETLLENIKKSFREIFMKDSLPCVLKEADGLDARVLEMTQTGIVLILKFGLCKECEREKLVNKLCELIDQFGGRMSTGFVGTPYILHALSENGRADRAFDLLFQEKTPSWLFSVNQGATTIWEHWDSIREDGTFWSTDMNSFNHYAYGCVYDWIFGVVAGVKVPDDGAGYKKVNIMPHTDRRLGFVNCSLKTENGKLRASWRYLSDQTVRFEYEIPNNTVAELTLPNGERHTLNGGTYVFEV